MAEVGEHRPEGKPQVEVVGVVRPLGHRMQGAVVAVQVEEVRHRISALILERLSGVGRQSLGLELPKGWKGFRQAFSVSPCHPPRTVALAVPWFRRVWKQAAWHCHRWCARALRPMSLLLNQRRTTHPLQGARAKGDGYSPSGLRKELGKTMVEVAMDLWPWLILVESSGERGLSRLQLN